MCGVVGWFSTSNIDDIKARSDLLVMTDTIAHRGPDGEGRIVFNNCALGHRRLSIIDIEKGHQPLNKKGVCISFNGEIYNYQELRQQLINSGCHFETNSDTEVILELYRMKGLDGFSLLRGMFAFVIWNEEQNTGHLIRDSLGIKPLFYSIDKHNNLTFASEAKAIIAKTGKTSLNVGALHLLLNFRYIPTEDSLFNDVKQLKPGEIITWRRGELSSQYFDSIEDGSSDDILEILNNSVRCHMVADVEVGSYLSGGIDSGLLTALMTQNRNTKQVLNTFTLGVGDDPNELHNAADTALFLKVDNTQLPAKLDAQSKLKSLIWHLEKPKVNSLQSYVLASEASKYTKVAISGLGGDELFLGYNAHKWMQYVSTLAGFGNYSKWLSPLLSPFRKSLQNQDSSERMRAFLIATNPSDFATSYGILRNVWDYPKMRERIYGARMLDENLPNAFELIEKQWCSNLDPVMAMREFEWKHKLVNDLLWQEDRCSMAHGLEVRVPFVDGVVKNHVWKLSKNILMPNGVLKGYLKNLSHQLLSSDIVNRQKSGFQVDSPTFFHTELTQLAEQYLNQQVVEAHQIFNFKYVSKLLSLPTTKNNRWHYFMLYMMIGTHIWLELFEQTGAPYD